jgi:2-polyprenyl-6-methoxyphenol hydroxylase-like FAD-dependent oxidoreductase
MDISDFPTRHNYGLALLQVRFEQILAGWVDELAVPIYRGREVTGFTQDDSGVDIAVSDGQSLRAEYLLGCDGGRSLIRRAAGIDFPGWDPTISSVIAEVEMDEEPEIGIRRNENGTQALGRLDDGKRVGVVVSESDPSGDGEPTLSDLREALIAVWGTDYGLRRATWISRFTDMTRQAASYRNGRVLLAGDAAHVHYPIGGQGLNIGVQDAVNLGWKLAQVVKRTSRETLLDTYHAERHPVGARVLQNTMAQTALTRSNARTDALRDTLAEVLGFDEPRRHLAGMLSGLDIHYDLGEGHPLLGRRMPDLDLVTADGPLRVFTLLHDARPVLLNLGEPGGFEITPWADRVQMIDGTYVGGWELPVIGEVAAPTAVLIRPDGYVAWVGELGDPDLPDALTSWFGPPAAIAPNSRGRLIPRRPASVCTCWGEGRACASAPSSTRQREAHAHESPRDMRPDLADGPLHRSGSPSPAVIVGTAGVGKLTPISLRGMTSCGDMAFTGHITSNNRTYGNLGGTFQIDRASFENCSGAKVTANLPLSFSVDPAGGYGLYYDVDITTSSGTCRYSGGLWSSGGFGSANIGGDMYRRTAGCGGPSQFPIRFGLFYTDTQGGEL